MKKLLYLAVILCFVQVGISHAQAPVSTDAQKKQMLSSQNSPVTTQTSVTTTSTDEKKTVTTSNNAPAPQCNKGGSPSCCQGKSSSCCSGMNSTGTTMNNDKKKEVMTMDSEKKSRDKSPK